MANPAEAMTPHSLTKASCAACEWRQGPGAAAAWIPGSETISEECIAGCASMFRVTALRYYTREADKQNSIVAGFGGRS